MFLSFRNFASGRIFVLEFFIEHYQFHSFIFLMLWTSVLEKCYVVGICIPLDWDTYSQYRHMEVFPFAVEAVR